MVYVLVLGVVLLLLPSRARDAVLGSVLLPGFEGGRVGGGDEEDVLRYVDPLIGTAGGGHVFPGATVPYGKSRGDGKGEKQG